MRRCGPGSAPSGLEIFRRASSRRRRRSVSLQKAEIEKWWPHGGGGEVSAPGILAIFNDAREGREAELDAWFQSEHLQERLAVPGFLFGRRHEAITASSAFFNYYVVESPDVLTSKPYLERLDNPTPMTKRIMSEVFINMNRTVCHRVARRGAFRGSYVVTARYFAAEPDIGALTAKLDELVKDTAVAGGEIWKAVDSAGRAGLGGRTAARRR